MVWGRTRARPRVPPDRRSGGPGECLLSVPRAVARHAHRLAVPLQPVTPHFHPTGEPGGFAHTRSLSWGNRVPPLPSSSRRRPVSTVVSRPHHGPKVDLAWSGSSAVIRLSAPQATSEAGRGPGGAGPTPRPAQPRNHP